MNGQAGKGDTYRPVDAAKYAANYERIFGKEDRVQTWYVCPQCNKQAMNRRNPCPKCGPSEKQ